MAASFELIPIKDALDFLSASAPRPWLKRMLAWMVFTGELDLFSTRGRIAPKLLSIIFNMRYLDEVPAGEEKNKLIEKGFEPDVVTKILSTKDQSHVEDVVTEWSEQENAHLISGGFFVVADSIVDWEENSLRGIVSSDEAKNERLFWNEEGHLGSNFEEPEFEFDIEGLCFQREAIEMIQPGIELASEKRGVIEARLRPGRPRLWDWDGALLHLLAIAQRPDGLPTGPGAQAQIERLISDWFQDTVGNAPSPSQVRQHAGRIMRVVEKPETP